MKGIMTLKRAEEICSEFKQKRILIFGDVILDRYIFGDVERISPEAPVPVLKVSTEEFRPGGAGNVAANIDSLGAASLLFGITGDDGFAEEISRLKPENNFILKSNLNKTVTKTRLIAQRQQIVRIDREEPLRVAADTEQAVKEKLNLAKKDGIDAIVVSDYAKGSLTEGIMHILQEAAASLRIPIVVDPKPPNFHLYHDITGITPNLKEAESLLNHKIADDDGAAAAIEYINNKFKSRFSIITRGSKGITAGETGQKVFHQPAYSHEVFDVTGAGDTVVSVLVLALVSGAALQEAVILANAAASIVVEKVGTSRISPEELLSRMKFLLAKK